MDFSILIPVKDISGFLYESIPKMLKLHGATFEIIIIPNQMPKTIPLIFRNKKIRILSSGKVSPALKRDIAANAAKGKYLAFIDDDAYPREDWLEKALEVFKKTDAEAIGGPAITPDDDTVIQKASGLFFETLTGGGGMSYRYRPVGKEIYVDDFPTVNMFVRKDVFESVGGFDNEYWPGEDTKFCLDLVKKGYKIFYSSNLIVWHHRRDSISGHLKQVGGYGRHRGYFAKKFPETSFRLTYFIPTMFVLANLILFVLMPFRQETVYVWFAMIMLYLSLITIDSAARTDSFSVGLMTVTLIILSHLFYGIQFLRGYNASSFRSELR